MNVALLLPLMFALFFALLTAASHRRLRPDIAAALLTAAIIGATIAVLPTLFVLSLGFIAHQPFVDGRLDWCRDVVGFHTAINPWIGGVASLLLVAGAFRLFRVWRGWHRFHRSDPGALEVVESDGLFAYSLPGAGRRVTVSSGLIEALDPAEFAIVIAHERSHADNRHDRHLLVADLAVAVFPLVAPVRSRLRFALERWADEAAVVTLGCDRRLAARTLARVALAQADMPPLAAAFNGLGVAARVEALLRPPPLAHQRWWSTSMQACVGIVILTAAIQAHHVFALLLALCPG